MICVDLFHELFEKMNAKFLCIVQKRFWGTKNVIRLFFSFFLLETNCFCVNYVYLNCFSANKFLNELQKYFTE